MRPSLRIERPKGDLAPENPSGNIGVAKRTALLAPPFLKESASSSGV